MEETWERTPEVLWKHVARELMKSAIADKKVRVSSRICFFLGIRHPGSTFSVQSGSGSRLFEKNKQEEVGRLPWNTFGS